MTLTWAYTAHCEVGLVRKNNQDSAFVSPSLLVVADGMGGAAAGDIASAVAVAEFNKTVARLPDLFADAESQGSSDSGAITEILAGVLARANERLADLVIDDPALEGMGTTVCGLMIHNDAAVFVNIGDSRAYLLRDGVLTRMTHDHSWVQTLVDSGRLSEAEALEHPHRSLILRVLNGSPTHAPDFHPETLLPGDRIMICSDGLCGLVTDAELATPVALPDRSAAIDSLVGLAHNAGGHDNITIIVADVTADGPPGPIQTFGAAASIDIPAVEEQTLTIEVGELTAPEERAITEDERYALSGRRRPATLIKVFLGFLLPILALVAGGHVWYSFSQTQFFVGAHEEKVAIFRGVPDEIPGVTLRHLVNGDGPELSNLPDYYATAVRDTIRVDSLESAQSTVTELQDKAKSCIAQRAARLRPPRTPAPSDEPVRPGLPTPLPQSASPTPSPSALDEEC